MNSPDELRRKLQELERLVRDDPADPALHCRIAALLEKLDRPTDAISELREANRLRPGDAAILEMLGNMLIRTGEYDEALDCYCEALECVDGRASLHLGLATALAQLRRRDEALAEYRQAVNLAPGDLRMLFGLAAGYAALNRHAEAAEVLEQAREQQPENLNLLRNLARAWWAAGQYERAAELLQEVVRRNPQEAAGRQLLGRVQLHLEDPLAALTSFSEASALGLQSAELLCDMATALRDLGREEEAMEAVAHAVERDPQDTGILYNAGLLHAEAGNYAEAADWFARLLELDPQNLPGLHDSAIVLERLGRHDEALETYERAIEFHPDDASLRNHFGNMLYNLGRYPQARDQLRLSLKLRPDDPDCLVTLGAVHACTGDLDKARECYARAIEVRGDFPVPYYNSGLLELDAGKPALAEKWMRRALAVAPGDESCQEGLARCLYLQARFVEVVDLCRDRVQDDPDCAWAWRYYAAASMESGNHLEITAAVAGCRSLGISDARSIIPVVRQMMDQRRDRELLGMLSALGELEPSPELLLHMGVVLRRIGRHSDALDHITLAGEKMEPDCEARLELALVHMELGNKNMARQALQDCLELLPSSTATETRLAVALYDADMSGEAVAMARNLVDGNPESARHRMLLGQILLLVNNYEQAASELEAAAALGFSGQMLHTALAQAYRKLGRRREASEQQRLCAGGPDQRSVWKQLKSWFNRRGNE